MSDSLGPIPIPDPVTIGAFPLTSATRGADYGSGVDLDLQVVTHVFDQPGLKSEQRYLLGPGARRFRFQSDHLSCTEYDQLKTHFQQAKGQYAQFPYTHWGPAGSEVVTARYENPNLTINQLVGLLASLQGLTLLEVPAPAAPYTSVAHVSRFPDSALTTALLDQVQRFIPMIKIQARTPPAGAAPAALYISDQRATIDGQLYLPRLASWNGIAQTMNEASDNAQFTMGNADDVWTKYGNAINLQRAKISFSLFHVNSNYVIDLWAGYARPWTLTSDGLFVLPASDGVFDLGLNYPFRQVSRTCWKIYRGPFCPASASNGFPDCPKSYEACVARGVPKSFGGVVALPQTVHIKDNSTGVFGFGRSNITSVSIADDSIYARPIQEVYTDKAMKVVCDVASGRDESEFYSALGIVGEGPIGSYDTNLIKQTLDDQPPHDPKLEFPLPLTFKSYGGWRGILGNDPAGVDDYFAIDQAPWDVVPPNATYAAGLAFAEIRRADEKGVQLSKVSDRKMEVSITQGISGWTWTAPGSRVWTAGISNCVWVAVNVYLRARGLRVTPANETSVPAAVMEQYFDVAQAISMATDVCDKSVENMLVPGQFERQFPFRGVLKERKPLKDWLTEILNCCLGYYTFTNGKLWIGIRYHSGATNAFRRESILYKSLQATPLTPQFNWLIGQFGDEEFDWALNSVTLYDIDHATFLGETNGSIQYLQSSMNFVGVSNKSQCARIITTRLREELGGVGPTEQLNARNLRFRTTLLALGSQVGDVISMTDDRLPTGYVENRVQSWQLNPDYSIDIVGTCTTDAMYDVESGPKPVDVPAAPPILELLPSMTGLAWMPNHVAPFANDPLYPDPAEKTFDLWQDYSITKDGKWEPAVWISGEQVINHFAAAVQPRILGASLVAGGSLAGPMVVYAAVGQHGAPPTAAVLTTGTVAFVGTDAATLGDWKGVYGQDGGDMPLTSGLSHPSYVTTSGWVLASSPTTAIPGFDYGSLHTPLNFYLQDPGSSDPTARVSRVNYTNAEMIMDLAITDGQAHTLAVYFYDQDGDGSGRVEHVWMTDSAGAMLDDRGNLSNIGSSPRYVVWTISGNVRLHVADVSGTNAVVSGVFFSTPSTPPPTPGAGAGYTYPSNMVALVIPAGATGQALKLDMVPADGSWTDWDLYVGTDRRQMPLQLSTTAALPASYTFNGPIHPMTQEMPEGAARRIRIAAKVVHHSGVAGVTVTGIPSVAGIPSTNQIQCNDFIGSTDTWNDRIVSALADFSDGSAPLWNFKVTAFDSASGTLTVTPGFAADPVDVGDVLIVRSVGITAGPDYVEDPMWDNYVTAHQFGNAGLIPAGGGPDEEKGRLYRILRGRGVGQVRQITGNTGIRIFVHPDWDVIPDATSIGIVEAPEYPSITETSDFDAPSPGIPFEQRLRLENLANKVVLVTGYLIDDQNHLTDEEFAVHREIYIYGEPPGVRDIGPEANDPATSAAWLINETDETVRVDTSANDVNVKLLPLVSYHGRELKVTNNNGPHNVTVTPTAGDPLFDANTTVTVAPLETARFTAG